MSTYSDLVSRIASDYINRSDFTNEIKRAILASIRYYEVERWQFNETSTAITTTVNQGFVALPSNYLAVDYLQISAAGGLMRLLPTDLESVLTLKQTSSTGIPTHYCVHGGHIEIAIVPDSAYSCPLHYIKTLPELSADTDSNGWTNGLFQDVIAYHAAKEIWSNTLRNANEASRFAQLEQMAVSRLNLKRAQYEHTGIRPTYF